MHVQHRIGQIGIAIARFRRNAERLQKTQRHIDSRLNLRVDLRPQAAAVVIQLLGLYADQQQMLRIAAQHLRHRQHFLESGLMQAHFLCAQKIRHVLVFDPF